MRYELRIMHYALCIMIFCLVLSCGHQGTNGSAVEEKPLCVYESSSDGIRSLQVYDHKDTAKMGSHTFICSIHRAPDDSLAMVQDDLGDLYKDNFYQLKITKDGAPFFSHRYTKKDVTHLLNKSFIKYGILDGFRFVRAEGGNLYFGMCVSYPESDMFTPFMLTVDSAGGYTIQVDESPLEAEEEGV